MTEQATTTDDRQEAFFERIANEHLVPAHKVFTEYAPEQPQPRCLPWIWHFDEILPHLLEGGELIPAEQADRRALLMHNPGLPPEMHGITQAVSGDYQLILPGEIFRAHRHTQTAFRLGIEGEGGYTAIEGEKIYVKTGDLIVQPPGLWHHHGNDGDQRLIWFDALDVGIVTLFDAPFFHAYSEFEYPAKGRPGDSLARYGSNAAPVGYQKPREDFPLLHYPYERMREALESLRAAGEFDPYHGAKLRYLNPVTGGHCMPTMAAFMQLMPESTTTVPYRSTDSTVFVVVRGSGETRVGDTVLRWRPWDVFVVPSWQWHHHEVREEAVLFSYSDRAAQEKLGLWCEEKGNNPDAA